MTTRQTRIFAPWDPPYDKDWYATLLGQVVKLLVLLIIVLLLVSCEKLRQAEHDLETPFATIFPSCPSTSLAAILLRECSDYYDKPPEVGQVSSHSRWCSKGKGLKLEMGISVFSDEGAAHSYIQGMKELGSDSGGHVRTYDFLPDGLLKNKPDEVVRIEMSDWLGTGVRGDEDEKGSLAEMVAFRVGCYVGIFTLIGYDPTNNEAIWASLPEPWFRPSDWLALYEAVDSTILRMRQLLPR